MNDKSPHMEEGSRRQPDRTPLDRSASHGQKPSAAELLETPGALLSRGDLRDLGLERRAVDAIFRACAVIVLPGYSRPLIRVGDYQALIEASTYRGDRVRGAA